jgi:hypothetical protein
MKISNSTGKNKDFYDLGKKMFDRIRVLPEHQAIPQSIPQKHSSKRMTDVFKLIEANGLTLHGDIEHFAELVRADERERLLQAVEEMRPVQDNPLLQNKPAEFWIRSFKQAIEARGNT